MRDATEDGTSLIILDIDRFKAINDQFGHPGGDEILIQLAHLLARKSRRGDVVCRLGGDEVAMLLPGCSMSIARRRAEELVAEVRWHGFTLSDGSIVNVSVSAGPGALTHACHHCPRALPRGRRGALRGQAWGPRPAGRGGHPGLISSRAARR